ncbi:DUF2157 domain-containing protein [Candidatus Peregrinibacteria bacterium]|nr:DUF2157 domain-containing protein [Candidatus Peregrinibacteria bacterium]
MNIQDALRYWQEEGLLSKEKARELQESLKDADDHVPNKAIRIFSAIGGILIGLGVILFVASNWSELTSSVKTAILILGMLLTGYAGYDLAYVRKTYEKTGLALLFVNVLIFGASIFLVAQIYHLPLTFWWGALLWLLVTAFFAYILQSRLHAWLTVPLSLLFLGWFRNYGVSGFSAELDFLFNARHSLVTLFPVIGAALIGKAVLQRKYANLRFASDTCFNWGIFLVIFATVLTTAERELFYNFFQVPSDWVALLLFTIAVLLLVAGVVWGKFVTKQGQWGLAALGGYLVYLYAIASVPRVMGYPLAGGGSFMFGYQDVPDTTMLKGLFVLHILLAFVFLLVVVWYGTMLRMPIVINMGMLGLAITIFIQYVSWAFEALDRSMAFILGGVLILGLSAILERKRRQLVSAMKK